MDKLFSEFNSFITGKGYLRAVNKAYAGFITDFENTLSIPAAEADEDTVINYMTEILNTKDYCEHKKGRFVVAFIFYYNGLLRKNFSFNFNTLKYSDTKIPVFFTQLELKRFSEFVSNHKFSTIFALSYYLGLKPGEIRMIRYEHYNEFAKTIVIYTTKGVLIKTLHISDALVKMLKVYIEEYLPKVWLFEGPNNKNINDKSIRTFFNKVLVRSKICKKATFETLRNSFIVHQTEKGMEKHAIIEILGLKSIRSTNFSRRASAESPAMLKGIDDDNLLFSF